MFTFKVSNWFANARRRYKTSISSKLKYRGRLSLAPTTPLAPGVADDIEDTLQENDAQSHTLENEENITPVSYHQLKEMDSTTCVNQNNVDQTYLKSCNPATVDETLCYVTYDSETDSASEKCTLIEAKDKPTVDISAGNLESEDEFSTNMRLSVTKVRQFKPLESNVGTIEQTVQFGIRETDEVTQNAGMNLQIRHNQIGLDGINNRDMFARNERRQDYNTLVHVPVSSATVFFGSGYDFTNGRKELVTHIVLENKQPVQLMEHEQEQSDIVDNSKTFAAVKRLSEYCDPLPEPMDLRVKERTTQERSNKSDDNDFSVSRYDMPHVSNFYDSSDCNAFLQGTDNCLDRITEYAHDNAREMEDPSWCGTMLFQPANRNTGFDGVNT